LENVPNEVGPPGGPTSQEETFFFIKIRKPIIRISAKINLKGKAKKLVSCCKKILVWSKENLVEIL